MTVDVDGIKRLLRSNEAQYRGYFDKNKVEIAECEAKLEHLKLYGVKLNFYIDKSTKILEIIEMDEKNEKPFKDIHKNLYNTDEYAD